MQSVLCLNGPNLDQLGRRDTSVYGDWTLAHLESEMRAWAASLDVEVVFRQSNHEGDLVEAVHTAPTVADALVLNPGSLTHSSPALGDALADCPLPVVEVHISNVRRRQRWRRRSYVAPHAVRSIVGRGPAGYRAALRHLVNREAWPTETVRYGPHIDQVVDLRRVEGSHRGVVLVHGGFWDDAWGSDTVESWAVDLATRGFSSAVIEYRRLDSGGSTTATTADAVRATSLAVEALESDAYALVGHSSGGQLALWAAGRVDPPPRLTVALAGVLDFGPAGQLGEGAVARFDPTHSTSPATDTADPGPVALVHGENDTVVPPSQSRDYAARRGESRVTLDIVAGGHFDALDPKSPAWQTVSGRLVEAFS